MAAAAFIAGFFAGRAVARSQSHGSAAGESLLVEGRVVYRANDGIKLGDDGSLVIFVPLDAGDFVQLAAASLVAEARGGRRKFGTLDRLESAGGRCVTADIRGRYSVVLPSAGSYQLVMISNHARRPASARPTSRDVSLLEEHFSHPLTLLGQQKYHLSRETLTGGSGRIDHDFGPDRG